MFLFASGEMGFGFGALALDFMMCGCAGMRGKDWLLQCMRLQLALSRDSGFSQELRTFAVRMQELPDERQAAG